MILFFSCIVATVIASIQLIGIIKINEWRLEFQEFLNPGTSKVKEVKEHDL
jgi:hypothetical protein